MQLLVSHGPDSHAQLPLNLRFILSFFRLSCLETFLPLHGGRLALVLVDPASRLGNSRRSEDLFGEEAVFRGGGGEGGRVSFRGSVFGGREEFTLEGRSFSVDSGRPGSGSDFCSYAHRFPILHLSLYYVLHMPHPCKKRCVRVRRSVGDAPHQPHPNLRMFGCAHVQGDTGQKDELLSVSTCRTHLQND